jgi:hypothetical protein
MPRNMKRQWDCGMPSSDYVETARLLLSLSSASILPLLGHTLLVCIFVFNIHCPFLRFWEGSYEIWAPSETFSSVFSYLCMHRGNLRWFLHFHFDFGLFLNISLCTNSILVHPLTREEVSSSSSFTRSSHVWPETLIYSAKVGLQKSEIPYYANLLPPQIYRDHEIRNAWIGPSYPLDLSTLSVKSKDIPLQYPSLSTLHYLFHQAAPNFILIESDC